MSRIRIVVDSAADFPAVNTVERHHIKVVPQKIQFDEEFYTEHSEMDAEQFFQRLSHNAPFPTIHAPTVEQYTEAYQELSRQTDKIISLHTSRHFSKGWEHARQASKSVLGRCEIAVIDSQTTSAGLGILAEYAAKLAERNMSFEESVRHVLGAVGRVYSIFYVDTLHYIQRQGLLGEAQSILGTMLGIKPFLTIEDGHLMTMEKVRTRPQAIDKLAEFVTEFDQIDRMVIVQSSPFVTEGVRMLQDRLNSEFYRRNFPTILYGATLTTFLGPDAVGVAVLEGEEKA